MALLLGLAGNVPAADWEVLTGCKFLPGSFNDGDSFHASYKGKTYVFRLYYVDAPEVEDQFPDRVKAQARYFRISPEEALKVGGFAAEFTEKALAGGFTAITCWQDAKGQTKMGRSFAFIIPNGAEVEDLGKTDLAALLIGNGLVRLYGAAGSPAVANAPSGGQIEGRLAALEQHARQDNLGAYSPSIQNGIKTGSATGVDFAAVEESSDAEKIANVSPDIGINMGNLEIKGGETFNGFSDIPGYKKPANTKKKKKSSDSAEPENTSPKIEINTATAAELQSLPVISPEMAGKIIDGRPYRSVDDLLHVAGISKDMLDLMKADLTCEGGNTAASRVEAEPPEDGRQ